MTFDPTHIRAAYSADGPRLVYADWLAEQGHALRAEYIVLSVRQARLPPSDPSLSSIYARLLELEQHTSSWLAPVHAHAQSAQYTRGLVEYAQVSLVNFPTYATDLWAVAPFVHQLWSADFLGGDMEAVAACAELRGLSALWLSSQLLDSPDFGVLLRSPHLRLSTLGLARTGLDEASAGLLARWPHRAGLRALQLAGGGFSTPAGRACLASMPELESVGLASLQRADPVAIVAGHPGLRTVSFAWDHVEAAQWERLDAELPQLAELSHASSGLSDDAVGVLADGFVGLERLSLIQGSLSDQRFRRLFAGRWSRLKSLECIINELECGAYAVLSDGGFPALRRLRLDGPPTREDAVALRGLAPQIEELSFFCNLSDESLAVILAVPWPKLHTLCFFDSGLSEDSVPLLCDRGVLPVLRRLETGVRALSQNPVLRAAYGWGLS